MALKDATETNYVCSVSFNGAVKMVQLTDYQDAKLHPDIKSLPKIVLNFLGEDWKKSSVEEKKDIGALFIPILNKEEIDKILSTKILQDLKSRIMIESTFWDDVTEINDNADLTDGELFSLQKMVIF